MRSKAIGMLTIFVIITLVLNAGLNPQPLTKVKAAYPGVNGKIVFQRGPYLQSQIYVMNDDGTEIKRLTYLGKDNSYPRWSPDGKKIAFMSNRYGDQDIFIMNADGSEQSRLTNNQANDWEPSWSPDGLHISFSSDEDGHPNIWVINTDGTRRKQLTYDTACSSGSSWSPDGNKIAFQSSRDGDVDIYVMNADGSGLTQLTNSPGCDTRPCWSPDGNKIVFHSSRDGKIQIYVMNSDGNEQTRLTYSDYDEWAPCWSPDGKKIAFSRGPWIFVINADGTGLTQLTKGDVSDWAPDWQPVDERSALIGEVPLIPQETDGSSWTASSQAILEYYGIYGQSIIQKQIAEEANHLPNYDSGIQVSELSSLITDLEPAIERLGKVDVYLEPSLTFDKVTSDIDRDRPIIAILSDDQTTTHWITIVGYIDNFVGEDYVIYNDPSPTGVGTKQDQIEWSSLVFVQSFNAIRTRTNDVVIKYETQYVSSTSDDSISNEMMNGIVNANTEVYNIGDGTCLTVKSPSLHLATVPPLSWFDPNYYVAGTNYEWQYPDLDENRGYKTAVSFDQSSFVPGFSASRSMDPVEFTYPETQKLTVSVKAEEPGLQMLAVNVDANKDSSIDATITSPTTDYEAGIVVSGDIRSLWWYIASPDQGETYSLEIDISVTPREWAILPITFKPEVRVQSFLSGEGGFYGITFERTITTEFGEWTWTWSASGAYSWRWKEDFIRTVQMQGTSTNEVSIRYEMQQTYRTEDDSVNSAVYMGRVDSSAAIYNTPDGTTQPIYDPTLQLTTDLPVSWFDTSYYVAGSSYEWSYPNPAEYEGYTTWMGFDPSTVQVQFTPGYDFERKMDPEEFTGLGTQTLTIEVTPTESGINNLLVNVEVGRDASVDASITSPTNGEQGIQVSEDGKSLWWNIESPQLGATYDLEVLIDVVPKEGVTYIVYKPDVRAISYIFQGEGSKFEGSTTKDVVVDGQTWSWSWQASGEYLWRWNDWLMKSIELDGTRSNEVSVDFLAFLNYNTRGDEVADEEVLMQKNMWTSIYNSGDGSGCPVEDTTLTCTPANGLTVQGVDDRGLQPRESGDPYVWLIGDMPQDSGQESRSITFVDSIMMKPGYSASRSVTPVIFDSSVTKVTLCLNVTPNEEISNYGIAVRGYDDQYLEALIERPTTFPVSDFWISDDRLFMWITISDPEEVRKYTLNIDFNVVVKTPPPEGMQVTFMPSIDVNANIESEWGHHYGESVTGVTDYGAWTWSATGTYLWNWNNRFARIIYFEGYALYVPTSAPTQGEIDTAIADGLAWLATKQNGDGSWDYQPPQQEGGQSPYPSTAITAMAVLAFEQQGHLPTGDPVADPYVENVRKGLDYILSQGHIEPIGNGYASPYDNPDANGDGFGISFEAQNGMYDAGAVIAALVGSLSPNRVATIGPVGFVGRTYREIVREAVEYCAWAQNDYGPGRGGWRYWANNGEHSFWDDFNTYAYGSDGSPIWGVISGTWRVMRDVMTGENFYSVEAEPELGAMSVLGNVNYEQWSSYSAQASIKLPPEGIAGLIFRWQDDGNYYRFGFADGQLELSKCVNGFFGNPILAPFGQFDANKWYQLNVNLQGDRIITYLWDDATSQWVQVFDVTDNELPISGSVGLYASSTACFDKVGVSGGSVASYMSDSDNSVTKWIPLGLYMAERMWEVNASDFVKQELWNWLAYSQSYDGGFGYDTPVSPNVLRTGGGISSLIYAGAAPDDPRVKAALAYLERNWLRGLEIGGSYDGDDNFGNIQAMYAVAKGCTVAGVKTIGGHDWYGEYAAWLLSNQVIVEDDKGYWPAGVWGNDIAETVWALLILGKKEMAPQPISAFAELKSSSDGDGWVEIKEAAEWKAVIEVYNGLTYDMKGAAVKDTIGKGLVAEVLYATMGKAIIDKGVLTWKIGDLKPGKEIKVVLRIYTLKDKAGNVGYNRSGAYVLDSGAKLEYTNDAKAKFSAQASPMPIAVWLFNARIRCPDYFRQNAYYLKQDLEIKWIGCDVSIDNGLDKIRIGRG